MDIVDVSKLLHVRVRTLQWTVNCVVGEIEKERLVVVTVDKVDCLASQCIGQVLVLDDGLPAANGQTYRLPAGSFFSLKDGQITRVVTYYNLADWIAQVSK